jgi:threonine efflux protein
MTGAAELWIFAGVMVLGQFCPGPDMLLLTRTALRKGAREGVEMAAGIACGLTVHATIAVAGVAVAFQRLLLLRTALQWVAATYLLWLAWGMAREFFVAWHSGAIYEVEAVKSRRAPFMRGLLCNLLNPKAALFLAAVCAPFLSGNHPAWWPYAIWGIIVGLGMGLAVAMAATEESLRALRRIDRWDLRSCAGSTCDPVDDRLVKAKDPAVCGAFGFWKFRFAVSQLYEGGLCRVKYPSPT